MFSMGLSMATWNNVKGTYEFRRLQKEQSNAKRFKLIPDFPDMVAAQ